MGDRGTDAGEPRLRVEPLGPVDDVPMSERVRIQGDLVVLRPYRPEDLDLWFDARMASAGDTSVSPVGNHVATAALIAAPYASMDGLDSR